MRRLDWLLVVLAFAAIGAGILMNGPICAFNSAPFGQTASQDCRFVFPIAGVVGLALAAIAVVVLGVRIVRHSATGSGRARRDGAG